MTLTASVPLIFTVTCAGAAFCWMTCVLQRSVTVPEQDAVGVRVTLAVPAVAPLPELVTTLRSVPLIVAEPDAAAPPIDPGSSTRTRRPNASEYRFFCNPAGSVVVTTDAE